MLAAVAGVVYLQSLRLPFDGAFRGVLYLMWSGNPGQSWIPLRLIGAIFVVTVANSILLLAWAIVWPKDQSALALLRWCYRFAPCWLLLLLLSTSLGRVVANIVYALAPWAAGDVTPVLARFEGPLLEQLQEGLEHRWISALFSGLYSWTWSTCLIGFGPWLIIRTRERAVSHVILGTALAALLAVPFFVLLPVFDPWATNPIYGYAGPGQTAVRYLYSNADVASLSTVAMKIRWATGSALPSLHVAYPLLFALVAARHRMRVEAWLLGIMTAATSVAVVYLGRHWIIDVIAAVPFAFGIQWLVERMDPRLAWGTQRNGS